MNKSYTEQLAEWVKKKNAVKKRDRNLVMFQAVKNDVCEAISAGYAIRTVWENMYETKRVTIGYHQFLKYTNQALKKANQTRPKQNTTQLVPKKGAKPPERPNPSNQQKPQNFKFDPSPNKEDWL